MLEAEQLSQWDLRDLAARAYIGEGPLERLFNDAVFGEGHDPNDTEWSDWPQHARDAWDRAVWFYRLHRDEGVDPEKPTPRGGPSLQDTWRAILTLSTNGGPWHRVPNLTWPRLAPLLGIGARSVHYYMVQVHGWELRGRKSSRRIVRAPCVLCSSPTDVGKLHDQLCPSCFDQTSPSNPR